MAKLRAVASDGPPICLHVEREGGHMGPGSRDAVREKAALVLAYVLDQLVDMGELPHGQGEAGAG